MSTTRESLSQEHPEDHSDKEQDGQRETGKEDGTRNTHQSPSGNGGHGDQGN